MKKNISLLTLQKVWGILRLEDRKAALYLFVMMVIGMMFEMLGVGVVIPVMTALMKPEMLVNYPGGLQLHAMLEVHGYVAVVVSILGMLVVVYMLKTAFLAFLAWRQADFTYGMLSSVSGRLFKSYLGRPYEFHLLNNSAELVRNAVTESQAFALQVISPAISLLAETLVLLGITLLLIYIEPFGSISAMFVVSAAAFLFYQFSKTCSLRLGKLRQHHEGLRIKTLQEGLFTVKEVILLGRSKNFLNRYDIHAEISASSAGRHSLIGQLPRLLLEFIAVLGCAGLFAVQILKGYEVNEILPTLLLFGAAALRLMPSVNRILIAINSLRYGVPVIDALHTELSRVTDSRTKGRDNLIANVSLRDFEFQGINFRYLGSRENALNDINIFIQAGEMVGFIGPSGAGKSSLVDVFLGLLSPTSGALLVNGEILDVDSENWKARIGYVPQSIVLVDDSIRRNVAFGLDDQDIDDDKVAAAILAAQLQDFVMGLSEGLNTQVGEHGVRLSGGQRQRIGLARALYGNPEILVLDEATSALDIETENEVMAAIRSMHGQKTILIIAHRLSTVRDCDKIVRLEKGYVIQIGSSAEILDGECFEPKAIRVFK